MKNYSRQFGNSKISDDVMIRAVRPKDYHASFFSGLTTGF